MNEKLIAYSRLVAIAASQRQLDAETAMMFCSDVVPQLLAELEVLTRVNAKFESVLQLTPQPEQQPCEATICSDRWKQPEQPAAEKKARKPRKKKARAK
jgi:hypothetical protein